MLNNMDPFVITQHELNGYFTIKHCAVKMSHRHEMVI